MMTWGIEFVGTGSGGLLRSCAAGSLIFNTTPVSNIGLWSNTSSLVSNDLYARDPYADDL